jgi:hypothetical protein
MAATDTPDFIELDMSPTTVTPAPDANDGIDLELDAALPAVEVNETQALLDARDTAIIAPDAPVTLVAPVSDFQAIASEASANASQAPAGMLARARMARGETPATVVPATPATPVAVAAITPGTLIASLLQDRSGKIFSAGRSDRRATHRGRTEIVQALGTVGRGDLAPRIKTNKAQFGEVMRGLNAPGLRMRAWNVTRRDVQKQGQEWPADLASRWCVGVLDGTDALGSLGEKVLIADLLTSNEIRFTGGNDAMHQKVSEAFAARMGDQTYNATDLLNWFRSLMQEEFHAVQLAGMIFVPGNAEATGPVCALVNALRPVLSRSIVEIDAVTGQGLFQGLAEGLQDEISEVSDAYDLACDLARKRDRAKVLKATPNASEADLELAERRAVVLPEAATSLLRRLNEKSDKVQGYETLIGSDYMAPVRAMIADLRAKIEPLCDSTASMAANIELS